MSSAVPIKAWHFASAGRFADHPGAKYSGQKIEAGQTYFVEPPIVPCQRGLHASRRAIDAMMYAFGSDPWICRVELSGKIVEGDDKLVVAERRTVLAMAPAGRTLHEFACWCAERALMHEREAGREPDARSWAAIRAKRDWLDGKITSDELAAASAAAAIASSDCSVAAAIDMSTCAGGAAASAWAAAKTAACAANWAAAWGAACAANWVAAAITASSAAEAAWETEREVQNTWLEKMLTDLLEARNE